MFVTTKDKTFNCSNRVIGMCWHMRMSSVTRAKICAQQLASVASRGLRGPPVVSRLLDTKSQNSNFGHGSCQLLFCFANYHYFSDIPFKIVRSSGRMFIFRATIILYTQSQKTKLSFGRSSGIIFNFASYQ